MKTILQISLRNLLRQKRRNILLGTAMAFGMMILVVANSFSHAISDTIFNKIVVYVSGHASVNFIEGGDYFRQVFRDGPRMREIVKTAAPEIRVLQESIGTMVRAIGNGKSDNMIIVGIDRSVYETNPEMRKEDEAAYKIVEGKFDDIGRTDIENPAMISVQKAKALNVKLNDVIKVRFRDINGHDVAHKLTVVGIFKSSNIFMQMPMFVDIKTAKSVLGYKPWETATLQMRLDNPKETAKIVADKIYAKSKPDCAVINGSIKNRRTGSVGSMPILAIRTDGKSRESAVSAISFAEGSPKLVSKSSVLISEQLAKAQNVVIGDTLEISYKGKYEQIEMPFPVVISGIYRSLKGLETPAILLNERQFYAMYNQVLPAKDASFTKAITPKLKTVGDSIIGKEWVLLERTGTSKDMESQMRQMGKEQFKATTVNVSSMYEMASSVLDMESALNLITLAAVLILFFIIVIGVVNTLQMTIRERTREIGTLRAIGMQKSDVRSIFILETMFLAFFSSVVGVIAGFVAMNLISLYQFAETDNPMAMLLVDQRIRFLPDPAAIVLFFVLILGISLLSALFPARWAAKLSPAKALRHFE